MDVGLLVTLLEAIERRLRDVDVAGLDQRPHVPEEEREDERADVRAVHVGVGHDDDLVVARLRDVELVAEAGADRADHGEDLVVGEHLVDARLLDVDDLAAQRQDRLEAAVARLLGRAAGRVALDEVDLAERRVFDGAVGELAGQRAALEQALAAREVARFARRIARPGRVDGLVDDLPRLGGVLFEELGQLGVHRDLDQAADLGVAQLALGLALELRVLELDRDESREPFADVLAGEVLLFLLEEALLAGVVVDSARERAAEAREVRAALGGVDVVGEREDGLVVRGVPLHRDLHGAVFGLVLEKDDAAVDGVLVAVDVGDEVLDAAVVLEHDALALSALVVELDAQAHGEEGRLAQALGEHAEVVVDLLEDVGVGHERHGGAGGRVFAELLLLLERADRHAALETLVPVVALDIDVELEPFGEGVDDGDADAVQTAGDLVAGAAELAAGVQHGEHDLGGGLVVLVHDPDGDAAAVVGDRHGVVGVDGDDEAVAVAGERLVDGVVDHLVHEMVKAAGAGGADVHAGAFADRLEAFEDLDILGVVVWLFHSTSQCAEGRDRGRKGRPDLPA